MPLRICDIDIGVVTEFETPVMRVKPTDRCGVERHSLTDHSQAFIHRMVVYIQTPFLQQEHFLGYCLLNSFIEPSIVVVMLEEYRVLQM